MEDAELSLSSVRSTFRELIRSEVAPWAEHCDAEQVVPEPLLRRLAERGMFGLGLPAKCGGAGVDMVTYGIFNEELARVSASVHGILNVHHMATRPLSRWGAASLRERWLPELVSGRRMAAFSVSEPEVGSDAVGVETRAVRSEDGWVLHGRKRWVTAGQVADVFLILARSEAGPTAFLVEADRPGLSRRPLEGLLGCRGYMLADLELTSCRVPADQMVGREGLGFAQVVSTGLDVGRYGLAWACTGMLQACLEASLDFATRRRQFGVPIHQHQLVQRMLSAMWASSRAARLMCLDAGRLRDRRDPRSVERTLLAKYFASTELQRAATDTVQIHGAAGCSSEYPVARYLRDAKVMEIIEGTTQIHEIMIAKALAKQDGAPD